jgi:hypothetical protein
LQRQLLASFFMLLMLSPAALSWLARAWQKHCLKETVEAQLKQGVEAADLIVLAFAKKEAERLLEWEHEREFEYQSQMYDVIKVESRNDSLFYTCYWDKAETALNEQLDRWMANFLQQSPVQQQQSERLACFFKSLYCTWPIAQSSFLKSYLPQQTFTNLPLFSQWISPPVLPPPEA